jgi:hypothetical protein
MADLQFLHNYNNDQSEFIYYIYLFVYQYSTQIRALIIYFQGVNGK